MNILFFKLGNLLFKFYIYSYFDKNNFFIKIIN